MAVLTGGELRLPQLASPVPMVAGPRIEMPDGRTMAPAWDSGVNAYAQGVQVAQAAFSPINKAIDNLAEKLDPLYQQKREYETAKMKNELAMMPSEMELTKQMNQAKLTGLNQLNQLQASQIENQPELLKRQAQAQELQNQKLISDMSSKQQELSIESQKATTDQERAKYDNQIKEIEAKKAQMVLPVYQQTVDQLQQSAMPNSQADQSTARKLSPLPSPIPNISGGNTSNDAGTADYLKRKQLGQLRSSLGIPGAPTTTAEEDALYAEKFKKDAENSYYTSTGQLTPQQQQQRDVLNQRLSRDSRVQKLRAGESSLQELLPLLKQGGGQADAAALDAWAQFIKGGGQLTESQVEMVKHAIPAFQKYSPAQLIRSWNSGDILTPDAKEQIGKAAVTIHNQRVDDFNTKIVPEYDRIGKSSGLTYDQFGEKFHKFGNEGVTAITSQKEFDELPAGSQFSFNGKTGTKH